MGNNLKGTGKVSGNMKSGWKKNRKCAKRKLRYCENEKTEKTERVGEKKMEDRVKENGS